jgi:hypothetical protein
MVVDWKLLACAVDFSDAAIRVNAIIWAIAGVDDLVGFLIWVFERGRPGHADAAAAPALAAVAGLLMFVMRALLRQATALRTDMEAVI